MEDKMDIDEPMAGFSLFAPAVDSHFAAHMSGATDSVGHVAGDDESEDESEDDDDGESEEESEAEDAADRLSQVSDADSDIADLQQDIRRQEKERYVFASKQHQEATGQPLAKPAGKGRRVYKRGPRKPAKPTADILYRMSKAKEAFEQKDYDLAIAILEDIIRINAETYQAWMLLSTLHEEREDRKRAIIARVAAAHLLHRNIPNWLSTAAYILDGVDRMPDGPEKIEAYKTASSCYSEALNVDRSHVEARMGKADVLLLLGQATLAMQQYERLVKYRPLNIQSVRNMADVALDSKDPQRSCTVARAAYRHIIDHCQRNQTRDVEGGSFEWSDLRIYLEFFTSLQEWDAGARELKEISRWLLGRQAETYWDRWIDDDREWDIPDDRRVEVPEFEPTRYPLETYGLGLPIDLRAKLYVYRLKLGQEMAAHAHAEMLNPMVETAVEAFMDFPDCLRDIGHALLEKERASEALAYYNLYRQIAEQNEDVSVDSEILVSIGRCYLLFGDKAAAEEYFIAAIEDDENDIDARIELAKMYEEEHEKEGQEEAFLLVNEAMNLEAQREGNEENDMAQRRRRVANLLPGRKSRPSNSKPRSGTISGRKKYIPRRLLTAEQKRKQEQEYAAKVAEKFRAMEELRPHMAEGDEHAVTEWMTVADDLLNDFRSFKSFYPWEKFIKYMGFGRPIGIPTYANKRGGLAAMAVRLQQTLAPEEEQQQQARQLPTEHRGLPLANWLDVFLEYAIILARRGQVREAYMVCHSARDSVVYTDDHNTFLIHLAWAICAVAAGDEETCVAVARYFMRIYAPGTDSYRMFSAICRVCQSPVSWYASGPAQKFFLRQIKSLDDIYMLGMKDPATEANARMKMGENGDGNGDYGRELGLDVCLLTIYGQILYTTGSYHYSMTYFARACSLDPTNPMINLSAGLAYLHHALQRQAKNRQYLLAQGYAMLGRYHRVRADPATSTPAQRQEANFNMGRAYSMLGLGHLAVRYYSRVLDEARRDGAPSIHPAMGREDLALEAAYNIRTLCYVLGDLEGARAITEEWLVL